MKTLAFAGMMLFAVVVRAVETTGLPAPYQALIERSPFGAVAASGAGELAPNWLANYSLTGIIQSNTGSGPVQAIISTKDSNRWYFRAEGEAVDANVTVVKIDSNQKQTKVVLKNGLETGTLTFADRPTVAAAAPPPGPQPGIPMPQASGSPGEGPSGIRRIPFRRSN